MKYVEIEIQCHMCTKAFTPMTKADKLSLENVSIIKVLCISEMK